MKKTGFSTFFINRLLVILINLSFCTIILANPKFPPNGATVFKRAASLDNGVSISWHERIWDKNILNKNAIQASDFKLLKKLGFNSIRLPVAFANFQSNKDSLKKALQHIDETLVLCRLYGFKIIICYHSGNLDDNNYSTETPNIIDTWTKLTHRYISESADNLFFELYNEPPHMDPKKWENAANNIVTAIRQIDKNRTLIVGASNFNSIYELSRAAPMSDNNIIYTFHFYEPFFFTHQGAEWVGDQVSTTGVPFPYNAANFPQLNPKAKGTWGETNYYQYNRDGNERSVNDKLQIVKHWALKYKVPVLCGEYGVYNKYADLDSRCRYIKTVRQTLKALNIPGMLWDYNTNFSIFDGDPSVQNLPGCMKEAIGFTAKK